MYVTYENSQRCIVNYKTVKPHPRIPFISYSTPHTVSNGLSVECNGVGPAILKSKSTHTDFRPTRLVRTSDMTVVPGSEAKNGYCALSYPWEWSGEIKTTRDPHTNAILSRERLDDGYHIHIERPTSEFGSLFFNHGNYEEKQSADDYDDDEDPFSHVVFRQPKGKKRQKTAISSYPKVRHVPFKEIIRQLCWMFEIDYIWYDQLCILQSENEDKQNEIRQMHRIYGNAQFTMVMIPEMFLKKKSCSEKEAFGERTSTQIGIQKCIEQIATSKWSKRAWTFEEAVLSKRLLFVGRNVHLWSDTIISTTQPWQVLPRVRHTSSANKKNRDKGDIDTATMLMSDIRDESHVRFVQNLCSITSDTISASSALWHIHRGESTEDHDKIFALANIFPRLMDDMGDFNYNRPLLPLMYQFYNNLIQHDLSVLCFGKAATDMTQDTKKKFQTDVIGVASWTGVSGSHMLQSPAHPMAPTTSFGRYFVTDEGYLSIYTKTITVQVDEVDRCPQVSAIHSFNVRGVCTASSLKATMDHDSYLQVVSYGLTPTHWLSHQDYTADTRVVDDDNDLKSILTDAATLTIWLSLVDNGLEAVKRCSVLIDVEFDIGMDGYKAYPVITSYGRYRTAIGMCIARNLHLLYNSNDLDQDELIVR